MPETIAEILNAYNSGVATPADIVARTYARLRAHDDPAMFITLRDESEAAAEASALKDTDKSLPLYGIPVAIKDNIDVAGMPTTAACPTFAYWAEADATVVARLRAAGALILGKLNLDQFATGLVGTRSPYGTPRNLFDPKLIPGGSSSGSGVAVGAGIVPLTLGTDTAGSGRVPAAFNNIVGLKPSVGLVSTFGVVPACRTLDCVTVFTLTVDDAMTVLDVIAGPDDADPFSRSRRIGAAAPPEQIRLGVPRAGERRFFGDAASAAAYDAALTQLAALGATIVEVNFEPFYETARLLYGGPWVAERYVVVKNLLTRSPEAILPVTRAIIEAGRDLRTANAFEAFYRLEELRRVRDRVFRSIDALVVPTAPSIYSIEDVLAEPIELNTRLGTYTNFANLLDLCGLAVPASITKGRPFGITLLAPGGQDAKLAALGRQFQAATALPLGALSFRNARSASPESIFTDHADLHRS